MEDTVAPVVSNEVLMVAIVNKDTLEDKLKEHALITLVTSVLSVLVTQGTPVVVKQITKFRTKRALAKKTKQLTEQQNQTPQLKE